MSLFKQLTNMTKITHCRLCHDNGINRIATHFIDRKDVCAEHYKSYNKNHCERCLTKGKLIYATASHKLAKDVCSDCLVFLEDLEMDCQSDVRETEDESSDN